VRIQHFISGRLFARTRKSRFAVVAFYRAAGFSVDFEEPYSNPNFPADSQEAEAIEPIFLASGDALLYKGCEVVHYRYPLPAGHRSTSLFFHYIPADFDDDLIM
jgi:hypothetical protein